MGAVGGPGDGGGYGGFGGFGGFGGGGSAGGGSESGGGEGSGMDRGVAIGAIKEADAAAGNVAAAESFGKAFDAAKSKDTVERVKTAIKAAFGLFTGNPLGLVAGPIAYDRAIAKMEKDIQTEFGLTPAMAKATMDSVQAANSNYGRDANTGSTGEGDSGQLNSKEIEAFSDDFIKNVASRIDPNVASSYDRSTPAIKASMKAIMDVNTDIEYSHTLADLSGIGMDEKERKLLYAQKEIAIDRAMNEIEDTFAPEGESIVAQQIHNLGSNALGGTIGREFVNRWKERESKVKTSALQDIESTYLTAERQGIDAQKQRQVDLWGKEYDADVKTAEFALDKAKTTTGFGLEERRQDISMEQQNLDRLLSERMGLKDYDSAKTASQWNAAGNIAGAVASSDWFSDVASSWI